MTGKPEKLRDIATRDDIARVSRAFRQSRVLLTAVELDLFSLLAGGGATSAEAAARIGADPRATDRLMNALTALGLLDKEGGRFSNRRAASRFLVRGAPEYMAGLGHSSNQFRRWATLTEAVRAGHSVIEREGGDDGTVEAFIAAMHARALDEADALIAPLDLGGVGRVLDVGGGSGVFAMAFCRAREGLVTVVLDLPRVTRLTREYVAEAGFSGRVETMDGDYLECDFGGGFDLVFFSAVVHINSPDENRLLMRKAFAALVPGGRVVIQDHVMDNDRTTPAAGALFALNMLVSTRGGDTYTEAEIRGWLEDAGLGEVEHLRSAPGASLIIGGKPLV